MQKLKLEYHFNFHDFKVMEEIEHSYFPNENITPAKEVFRWYEKNPYSCVGIRNHQNEIIASVNILPLKRGTFYDIYENQMNEADVLAEQVEIYEDNKSYLIYLSSISIDKEYRNHYQTLMMLLRGCIHLFDLLLKRDIKIEKVMADASTTYGERICKKLLKMDYIRTTDHESKIYCIEGEKFINNIHKIEK